MESSYEVNTPEKTGQMDKEENCIIGHTSRPSRHSGP
jgi:hypothetical protein